MRTRRWHSVVGMTGAAVLGGLGGCATIPSDRPVEDVTFGGDYRVIADCTYAAARRDWGYEASMAPHGSPPGFEVSARGEGFVRWTAVITDAGRGRTRVVFRSVKAVWGETFYADQVMPTVRSCAARSG